VTEDKEGMNIGKLEADTVAMLTVRVSTPDGIDPSGVRVQALGTESAAATIQEGVGAVASVPAGTYRVSFSKEGLADLVLDNVTLSAGEAKVIDDVTLTASGG